MVKYILFLIPMSVVLVKIVNAIIKREYDAAKVNLLILFIQIVIFLWVFYW